MTRKIIKNIVSFVGKLVDIPAPKEIWHWMNTAVQAIRELNKLDKSEADQNAQLIQWVSESPLDWQLGGPCKAFMFGRNKEGQLADATNEGGSPGRLYGRICEEINIILKIISCVLKGYCEIFVMNEQQKFDYFWVKVHIMMQPLTSYHIPYSREF